MRCAWIATGIALVVGFVCIAAIPAIAATSEDDALVAEWRLERRDRVSTIVTRWLRGVSDDELAGDTIEFIRLSVNIASVSKESDTYLECLEDYEHVPLQLLLTCLREDGVDMRTASFFEGRSFAVYDVEELDDATTAATEDDADDYSSSLGGYGGGGGSR